MWRAGACARGGGVLVVEACCRRSQQRVLGPSRFLTTTTALNRSRAPHYQSHHHHPLVLQQHASPSASRVYVWRRAAPFSTKPDTSGADQQPPASAAGAAVAATEEAPAAAADSSEKQEEEKQAKAPAALFASPAPRFFRLLAGASLTQIAFWTSYSWLPPELGSNLGYYGIAASAAFCFIARHFAKHYVWEVDAVSPVAFTFSGHTFWGNKGEERMVQVGTTQMQQTSRYIAFKVKGDTFWYLLDVKEGKFKSDEAKEQLTRMFMGLRPEGLDHLVVGGAGGAEGDEAGGAGRRGGGRKKWQGWKAKK